MKKALFLILALTLALALSVPALALDQNTTTGTTEITTTVDETYIVTIPLTKAIPWDALSTELGALTLTEARFEPGGKVTVTASSVDGLKNNLDTNQTIAYALNDAADDTAFESVEFDTVSESVTLNIDITEAAWAAAAAGDYSDTITFTVAYVAPTTPEP